MGRPSFASRSQHNICSLYLIQVIKYEKMKACKESIFLRVLLGQSGGRTLAVGLGGKHVIVGGAEIGIARRCSTNRALEFFWMEVS